jgi:hypothetical protein
MKPIRLLALTGLLAFTVTACGDDDDSGTTPTIDPPATPTVTAAAELLSVTVSWDAVADANDYVVELSAGDFSSEETVTGTTVTFDGLAGRTTYTAAVVARGQGGTSAPGTATASTGSLNEIFYQTAGFNNIQADPGFDASVFEFGTQASPPDFTLAAMPSGYTAATVSTAGVVPSVDGRALVDTDYAGAVAPGTALTDAWYYGWTVWAEDGSDSRDVAGANVITVDGPVLANTTWTSNNVYRLDGPIFVGVDCGADGQAATCLPVELTIEPGTTIIGRSDTPDGVRGSYLVVNRGSKLIADANANEADPTVRPDPANVIVFTSDKAPGERAAQDWGGLVINGRAPTNAGPEAEGEGDSGLYGGPEVNDDSGILRGVRIEFAGDDVNAADQLNGLALQGVGAGTTVSYVQIHYNEDDGIEPYGGTASVDHLVLTGIGDDSVDGTDGYQGFMQFIIGQQNGNRADNGFEISNNGDDEDAEPRSTAVIANATMIGAGQNVVSGAIAGGGSDNGIQFREGSFYKVYNSIFQGFGEGGFCIRDAQTIVNALARLGGSTDPTQTLSAEGLIMWDNQSAGAADNFAPCGGGSS